MATAITRITGHGIATGMHGYVAGAKSNAQSQRNFELKNNGASGVSPGGAFRLLQ
jgi:hypothetical protein